MSEYTITIPADLNGHLLDPSPSGLRAYADAVSGSQIYGASRVLRWLADEIERQVPRPEGWYHVETQEWERVYWWDGTKWTKGHDSSIEVPVPDDAIITPVTIGGAS